MICFAFRWLIVLVAYFDVMVCYLTIIAGSLRGCVLCLVDVARCVGWVFFMGLRGWLVWCGWFSDLFAGCCVYGVGGLL